jgi:hypothetical protein
MLCVHDDDSRIRAAPSVGDCLASVGGNPIIRFGPQTTRTRTHQRFGSFSLGPKLVKVKTPTYEIGRGLSVDQARTWLRVSSGDRFYAAYVLAVYLRLRRAELLGLRWADVDLDQERLEVTQTLQRVDGGLQLLPPSHASRDGRFRSRCPVSRRFASIGCGRTVSVCRWGLLGPTRDFCSRPPSGPRSSPTTSVAPRTRFAGPPVSHPSVSTTFGTRASRCCSTWVCLRTSSRRSSVTVPSTSPWRSMPMRRWTRSGRPCVGSVSDWREVHCCQRCCQRCCQNAPDR